MDLEKFDTNCKQMYGNRTCILYQINEDSFKVRFLDKELNTKEIINRNVFYKFIPDMITSNYTVVIIEKKEITTVHHPMQTNLFTPPLIQ